jgi:4-carboxymuconolactone decarboxylase
MKTIRIITLSAFLVSATVSDANAQTTKNKVVAPRASIERMKELSPEFAKLTDEVLFNDIWNRPGLSPRDKSLITISVLLATGRGEQAESHIKLGIDHGLTAKEIEAMMTHVAFYAGWPSAVTGLQKLKAVKDQKEKK